eukprot:2896803-Ditylum_brightwellii.AAC.1
MDNLKQLVEQSKAVSKKNNKLEEWKKLFDQKQEERHKQQEARFATQDAKINDKLNNPNTKMNTNQTSLLV